MSWPRRHLAVVLIVIASLLATAGCVNVPISGPIEKVEGQQPGCQNCVNVEVEPPAPGAKPKEIVEGYLRATSNYQPNYSVARQFLTPMAAEKWSPEDRASIYRGLLTATGDKTVELSGQHVGSLERDRTYTAVDRNRSWEFQLLEDDNGQWRIENPPAGLMIEEVYFRSFYQPYDLYFIGNGRSLVPDRIYLPSLSNPANMASALMKALLNGPSAWLKPAVSSEIPPNTSLSMDSVTIANGIAEVPLSDSVQDLPDPQRSLLAAQIVYTLRQVSGVERVLIKVNQQPYRVPGSDPNSLAISVDTIIAPGLDPIPRVTGDQLYAVREGAVKKLTTTTEPPAVSDLSGPLGSGEYQIDALAVSVGSTDLAVTANGRTTLLRAPIEVGKSGTAPKPLLKDVTALLRPQFTRYGEIWTIGNERDRQRIWVFTADGKRFSINPPVPGVTAFKISPAGTRMAMVSGSQVGIAQIIRSSDKIIVDHWRVLDTTQSHMETIVNIRDVAWLNTTELLVLGATDTDPAIAPFRVVMDASRITPQGDSEGWDARELAVVPQTQSAIIIGRLGGASRSWKYDGNRWLPFVDDVSTIAYPG